MTKINHKHSHIKHIYIENKYKQIPKFAEINYVKYFMTNVTILTKGE